MVRARKQIEKQDETDRGDGRLGLPACEPRLLVELPLEGEPTVRVLASSAEDEARLVAWAIRSRAVRHLGIAVVGVLDRHEREARR